MTRPSIPTSSASTPSAWARKQARSSREERHVARLDLACFRAHALGVEALEVGIDGLVILRYEIPRRDRLPRSLVHRRPKCGANDRLLRSRRHTCLDHRDISGEELVEPCGGDVQK